MNYTPTRYSVTNSYSERTSRDSSAPTENWENFFVESSNTTPSIVKSHAAKSRPTSKPSFGTSPDVMNKTIDGIRHSCFVGTLPQEQENNLAKLSKDAQDLSFLSSSIKNSNKVNPTSTIERLAQERRKSQSICIRSANHPPSFFKNGNEVMANTIKVNDAMPARQKDSLKELIEQLTARLTVTEEQIKRLKDKAEKERKNQGFQGEFKELRGKLLDLVKFNSKHFTEYECKLEEQQKIINEKLLTFNGADYFKKANLIQAKLHQLYEGFKIKEDHNEKQIAQGITQLENRIKEQIHAKITTLNETFEQNRKELTHVQAKIQKVQADFKEKIEFNLSEYQKSNKKSSNWKMIQSKELLIVRQNQPFKERPKNKLCTSPRAWVYQTPTKENVDTPIKQLNFQEAIEEMVLRHQTYFIDDEGYLLDENKYYLLNNQNQQIHLPASVIACLRDHGMIGA